MTDLEAVLEEARLPGAAAMVARGEAVEVASVGEIAPDSICRVASITKPITAAAVMLTDGALWREPPVFPSGAGGLVSTLADLHRFGRMLLADGGGLLTP